MDLKATEFLPIFASDMFSDYNQIDLYPVFLSDLEMHTEENEHNHSNISLVIENYNYENIVNGFISCLEKEQIRIMPDAICIIQTVAEEALNRQNLNINDKLETEEFIKKLYFEAEFILMTKPEDRKRFSLDDAETLSRNLGYESTKSTTNLTALQMTIEPKEKVDIFAVEHKEKNADLASSFEGHNDNGDSNFAKTEIEESVLSTIASTYSVNQRDEKLDVIAGKDDNIIEQGAELIYYRLKIKSFKGSLASLDKKLAQEREYIPKKALIEAAKKNRLVTYCEDISKEKLYSYKRILKDAGFVTYIEQASIKINDVIDYYYENGMLTPTADNLFMGCFNSSISYTYNFELLNKMNDVLAGESIRHVEHFRFYNITEKNIKYNKNGIIKLPRRDEGRSIILFTDTRILIFKIYSIDTTVYIISKTEIDTAMGVFEKKSLSTTYGQLQVKIKNGDVFVLLLQQKNYTMTEKDEFDKRVPFLEALIR